jgi:hypothetical protein
MNKFALFFTFCVPLFCAAQQSDFTEAPDRRNNNMDSDLDFVPAGNLHSPTVQLKCLQALDRIDGCSGCGIPVNKKELGAFHSAYEDSDAFFLLGKNDRTEGIYLFSGSGYKFWSNKELQACSETRSISDQYKRHIYIQMDTYKKNSKYVEILQDQDDQMIDKWTSESNANRRCVFMQSKPVAGEVAKTLNAAVLENVKKQKKLWELATSANKRSPTAFAKPNPENFKKAMDLCAQVGDPSVKEAAFEIKDKLPQSQTEEATLEPNTHKDGKP